MKPVLCNGTFLSDETSEFVRHHPEWMQGIGLLESVRVLQGRIPLLPYHHARLKQSAVRLGMKRIPGWKRFKDDCRMFLQSQHIEDGALRIVVTANRQGLADLYIMQREFMALSAEDYQAGVTIAISSQRRDHRDSSYQIKSLSRAWTRMIRQEHPKVFEVLIKNDKNEVCEGTTTNLILCKGRQAKTPALRCNVLPGVMRAYLLDHKISDRIPLVQGVIREKDLWAADEIFLCNALRGLIPVQRIGRRRLKQNSSQSGEYLKSWLQKKLPHLHS